MTENVTRIGLACHTGAYAHQTMVVLRRKDEKIRPSNWSISGLLGK